MNNAQLGAAAAGRLAEAAAPASRPGRSGGARSGTNGCGWCSDGAARDSVRPHLSVGGTAVARPPGRVVMPSGADLRRCVRLGEVGVEQLRSCASSNAIKHDFVIHLKYAVHYRTQVWSNKTKMGVFMCNVSLVPMTPDK